MAVRCSLLQLWRNDHLLCPSRSKGTRSENGEGVRKFFAAMENDVTHHTNTFGTRNTIEPDKKNAKMGSLFMKD